MRTRVVSTLAMAVIAGTAAGAPPAYTFTSVARTDQVVSDIGSPISSAIYSGAGQGQGILKVAVNDSGAWLIDVHVVDTDTDFDQALLRSTLGLSPYVAEGLTGYLNAISPGLSAYGFRSISLNAAGNVAWAADEAVGGMSSVLFNTSSAPIQQGAPVMTAGLDAGATWGPVDASTRVQLADSGRLLVVSNVVELGVSKRVVLVAQLDGSGAVTGRTLIAKETGPVGAGPDTWATIAGGGQASSINNSGVVVFSGTTASGADGIYSSATGFVAVRGGPTPVSGLNWGSLVGSPVDINNAGTVAFRSRLADVDTTYIERSDAGELIDTADRTFGNGSLQLITGELDNDQDVDMYRIIVTDAAAFSATTVPNPGAGFAGATWDTVLTIIASPENGTVAKSQCNNVDAMTIQSTVTGGMSGGQLVSGREYYVCVSSPKSRPVATLRYYATNTFPTKEIFQSDPAGLAVSGGIVYWPDPSEGVIRRHSLSSGSLSSLTAPAVTTHIAVDAAGGKIYWIDRGVGGVGGGPKIKRSNLDGTVVEDLVTVQGFGTLTADDATGLALDPVNGKIYWSRAIYGEINRCNLDGSGSERVYQDYGPTDSAFPHSLPIGNFAPEEIAVDGAAGKVYFINSSPNRIERMSVNGTSRQNLTVGAGGNGLALDVAAGKMYWTNPSTGKVQRANLDGTSPADVLSNDAPVALALDTAGGLVYWTNTAARIVRRATTAGAGVTDIASAGPEIGERRPDGPAATGTFTSWMRLGTATPGVLPYAVKLTGATFRHENAMIVKGGSKVVAVGDVIPGTAPYRIISVGSSTTALRMNGRGDVLWSGAFYQPTIYNNFLFGALFFNGERLLTSMDIPAGQPDKFIFMYNTPTSIDMSENGEWAIIAANLQIPPFNFTPQKDHAALLHFSLPPICRADFNGNGAVTVQDIFDFLAAYFASLPSADMNGSGTVTVQDIFDYLAFYFSGCP